jgi:glutamine phosphoribosylpyrophosphate amidotransferase
VIIDDSIVRGTTLKNEYYQNDGSFESKKVLLLFQRRKYVFQIVGIDMAKLEGLVAFKAALSY